MNPLLKKIDMAMFKELTRRSYKRLTGRKLEKDIEEVKKNKTHKRNV